MTPRRHPDERDLRHVHDELERYAQETAEYPRPGFADRVMAAVEQEPAPRRAPFGTLGAALGGLWLGPDGRPRLAARAALLVATVALAAVLVLAGGRLWELLPGPNVGDSSPSVSPSPSPSPTPSPTPSPSATPTVTPTPSPSPSPVSPSASPSGSPDDDDEIETPEPDETPESSDDSSGPGGGGDDDGSSGPGSGDDDDNSGPGGGSDDG